MSSTGLTFAQLAEAFRAYSNELAHEPVDVVDTLKAYEFDDPDIPEKVGRVLEATPRPVE